VTEHQAVETSAAPITVQSLTRDLEALGLRSGDVVLVHSSLSSLGWVCGGAVAVVEALLAVLEPGGTLVVPTQTGDHTDPADWQHPPVPASWWETIRSTMPAYRPELTPSRAMGTIAELVRTWPGALRSNHPHVSFAALGPAAAEITADHDLPNGLGDGSPLGRLYRADAQVLLLGVGYDRCTSLHLAEHRSGVRKGVRQSGPVLVDGRRQWASWDDIDLDETDFPAMGAALDRTGSVHLGQVGNAVARLLRQRVAVDFATQWLTEQAAADEQRQPGQERGSKPAT
jgi:aminoglycoside 3-N-acetyltransferase